MTKLLISVRDASEARIALDHGADLIDIKEPARGPLGAADTEVVEQIVGEVAGQVPVSVALGELLSVQPYCNLCPGSVQFAKFGLAGCACQANWTGLWEAAIAALPPGPSPVAVAYADWQVALAPRPLEVLAEARGQGCRAVLLDTFDKSRRSLPRLVSPAALAHFVETAKAEGLLCVLAGGLRHADIEEVLRHAPDYVAVRGAVCVGDRTGALSAPLVGRLASHVHAQSCDDRLAARR